MNPLEKMTAVILMVCLATLVLVFAFAFAAKMIRVMFW